MNILQAGRAHRGLLILLTVLLAAYLVQIHHGLPNRDIVWGYDANPLIPLIAAKKVFIDGWNTGWHTPYPNFHYWVLLLFVGPYMAAQWLLGNLAGLRMDGGYPYGLKDFETIFMHLAIITRLVSVAMALGAAYWVYRIGETLHSRRTGLFAACIMGFSPAVVYYVHIETLDVPMLFWLSAAMYCYVRVMQSFELRYYLWLAVLAAVSTATKDYAYGAFVLLPIPLVAALARHRHGSLSPAALTRAAVDGRHVKALLVFLAAFALAENWLWNFSGFVGHVKVAGGFDPGAHVITVSMGRLDFFSPRRLASLFSAMTFVVGWAGLAVCLTGVCYAVTRERKVAGILAWPAVSYYLFTICQVLSAESDIERSYMPLGIFFSILGGLLLAQLTAARQLAARALTTVAIAAIALNGVAMTVALVTDPRYQAEQWLDRHVPAGARIEFYGKRSELPRAVNSWRGTVINPDPMPRSDVDLTPEFVAPQSVAERNPDFIVVADAFFRAYRADGGTDTARGVHAFLNGLQQGALAYRQSAEFVSVVSDALLFPPRLVPNVTVYARSSSGAAGGGTR